MRTFVALLALVTVALAQTTTPYIGGNQFGNYYTNPNLINTFLSQINSSVNPACNAISGIGQPILAIKQVLQTIDSQLDVTNRDSNAKIIYFRERKNNTTFQSDFKLVLQIKGFSTNNYLAIEGVYKQIGFPTFEVVTYYFDSNIENIRQAMNEYTIDPNGFVGCGDVKSIYSQATSTLPRPTVNINGQQTNPSQTPYAQGNKLVNAAPAGQNTVDPSLVAQIVNLMQRQ